MTLKGLRCQPGSKRNYVDDASLFQFSMGLPIDVSKQLGLREMPTGSRWFTDSTFDRRASEVWGNASGTFRQRDLHRFSVGMRDVHPMCLYEVSAQYIQYNIDVPIRHIPHDFLYFSKAQHFNAFIETFFPFFGHCCDGRLKLVDE
jgi:hypothetical protein